MSMPDMYLKIQLMIFFMFSSPTCLEIVCNVRNKTDGVYYILGGSTHKSMSDVTLTCNREENGKVYRTTKKKGDQNHK